MKSRAVPTLVLLVIACGLGVGWWLGRSASEVAPRTETEEPPPRPRRVTEEMLRPARMGERPEPTVRFDREAAEAGALAGQRSITFSSREAMDRFLASLEGRGIAVLGRIDKLNTLRVGFLNPDELAALLEGDEQTGLIFPVNVPGSGSVQDGAVGFGRSMLDLLGANGDRSGWGEGIRVAVLDTGIASHSLLNGTVLLQNLVELPADLATQNGHGTAVASLIASELGLAPGTTLLSYRVADDSGSSNSFTLAEAVIAAADSGAHVINISMGSQGNSVILQQAIEYALQAGSVIVASAGNEGGSLSYPAAYDGVVAVGAVDARWEHLDFSNTGNVTVTAPGLDIASAWVGDESVLFSGTSASAPIVSGAIAALMTTNHLSAQQAIDLLVATANENGAPGLDPEYGEGVIDLGRALNDSQHGITDIALASNYLGTGSSGQPVLQVTVENRGTTTVFNAPVTVTTPWGTSNFSIGSLPSGKIQTFELPLYSGALSSPDGTPVESTVTLSSGGDDLIPSNNRRSDVLPPAETP